jgi:hypothetical protein
MEENVVEPPRAFCAEDVRCRHASATACGSPSWGGSAIAALSAEPAARVGRM